MQLEDLASLFQENSARFSQVNPSGNPVEQGAARFLFQLGDNVGHGGLGHIQALGGAGEAALLADGAEHFQLAQVHDALLFMIKY